MWRAIERVETMEQGERQQLIAQHERGHSPWLSSAKLKLVDACNLRCFMCDYWKGQRRDELSTEEVTRVLDGLAELGCQKVHFTGGELFLRKDVIALATHAKSLGIRVNMTTNGTRLDAELIRELLQIPVRSITLSIDSAIPRLHDALRGRKGAHKLTTRSLDRLLRWRKRRTKIRLNTVVSKRNWSALVEMPAYLRDRPVDGWLLIPVDPWTDAATAPDAEDITRYNQEIAPVLAELVRVPNFDPWIFGSPGKAMTAVRQQRWARGYYDTKRCHVPWFHTLIDARGDVYPCCMGHRRLSALGNVRSDTVSEIFRGSDYLAFRQSMRVRRPEICHRCDDFLAENKAYDGLMSRLEKRE